MSNILFIGPYRQYDEYGDSAKEWLKCLLKLDSHNISCVPLYISKNINNTNINEFIECENTYCDHFDIVIHHSPAVFYEKLPGYNIGIYHDESQDLKKSLTIDYINILDELWVNSHKKKEDLIKDGVTIPICVTYEPLDLESINTYNIPELNIPGLEGKFIFYMTSEYSDRDNLQSALIAFNREFSHDSDVVLLINTYIYGDHEEQHQKIIKDDIIAIKNKLKLYNTLELQTNEILITNKLNREQTASLHQQCHCLLITSKHQSSYRLALEALYYNNDILCTKNINIDNILTDNCIAINSIKTPIFSDQPSIFSRYNGWETHYEIDILDLQDKMRFVYNDKIQNESSLLWLQDYFSHSAIAKKIKDSLCLS